ncbi:hypothetical protein F5I97DRAFT_1829385 [Phlebopus sp. FC_14]|nr:hypothetical protein F5I97DRAFT_1829385 [Phlebopus sp. FC_14]
MSSSIRTLPPEGSIWPMLNPLGLVTGTLRDRLANAIQYGLKPKYPPLEVLPCANVHVEKYMACENQGKMTCIACKLVSYCSKECQKAHWPVHKRDCNDRMRSASWKPAWVAEGRLPTFLDMKIMSGAEELWDRFSERLGVGMSLWSGSDLLGGSRGNMPAMDVVKIHKNELGLTRGLSLAFVASGDLRHVVQTVNCLGNDYSGHLKILLNDRSPPVVSRNLILLLILGSIPDEAIAADIALHFWYSAFMPVEYRLRISAMLSSLLRQDNRQHTLSTDLGSKFFLTCMVSRDVAECMSYVVDSSMSVEQAQAEYDRVRNASSRLDFRDQMYAGLKPSHRLAFLEFRRFGIVLPFGAINAHFNATNRSLFSPRGEWLQSDYADPLAGWETSTRRTARGHLRLLILPDQLRTFARRVRELNIAFYVSNADACGLSKMISSDTIAMHGIPSTMRFDRVEVSNILDPNYVGIRGVLASWGPLLAQSDKAAIVGYFMNWMGYQQDARTIHAGKGLFSNLLERLGREGKTAIYLTATDVDTLYDNSVAFSEFLKKQGLDNILDTLKLKLRDEHTIIPHRIGVPLEGKKGDLPFFPDDESWYRHTKLHSQTFTERFVEVIRG